MYSFSFFVYFCCRHIGDLGNLDEDAQGNVFHINKNDRLTLRGRYSIVGRTWDVSNFLATTLSTPHQR